MMNIFPSICDHTTNLLFTFNIFKVFQDYFSRYLEKDDRNNGKKVRDHIWFTHTVVSLMIQETIILLTNTCLTVLLQSRDKLKIIQENIFRRR